jgi:Ni/Co efflux regulator RcnB
MRRILLAIVTAAPLLATLAPAQAHHSAAMFDAEHTRSLTGTVREFQWTNPHSYIQLIVKNERGEDEEWSLEMGAPVYLYNQGWRRSTVKAGDRLTVTVAPLRNGDKGGLLLKAVTADGKALGKAAEVQP